MKFTKTVLSTLSAAVLAIVALGLASAPVQAATATATIAVSATVQATCSVSATALVFGNYTTVVNANTATVSVTCTNTTPYTLGLNAGLGTGATTTNRYMMNGAILLSYGLFTDAAHTTNFATLASANGTGNPVVTTVYGQIPAAQYVTPGAYTDQITATVTY